MNDALRTDVFVRYTPEAIACACIWLAGRQLKIPLPESPPWYHIFRVSLSDIEHIAAKILKLYTRKKIKLEILEAKVDTIRRIQQEARLRSRGVGLQTPKDPHVTFSPQGSKCNTPAGGIKGGHLPHDGSGGQRSQHASQRKRESSDRQKDGRSRSRSVSPRHTRKKTKRSRTRSRSRSRSRSRDRKGRYGPHSRSPSPAVTPPPLFTKNKEKGSIVRSVSRSRSPRSPLIHRYDKYDSKYDKYSNKYDKYDRMKPLDRYDVKTEKELRERRPAKEDMKKYYDKYDKYDKYPIEKDGKKPRDSSKTREKKYYDNGYEKHHKAKKNGRRADRENRNRR